MNILSIIIFLTQITLGSPQREPNSKHFNKRFDTTISINLLKTVNFRSNLKGKKLIYSYFRSKGYFRLNEICHQNVELINVLPLTLIDKHYPCIYFSYYIREDGLNGTNVRPHNGLVLYQEKINKKFALDFLPEDYVIIKVINDEKKTILFGEDFWNSVKKRKIRVKFN